jgi:hypothetical protein
MLRAALLGSARRCALGQVTRPEFAQAECGIKRRSSGRLGGKRDSGSILERRQAKNRPKPNSEAQDQATKIVGGRSLSGGNFGVVTPCEFALHPLGPESDVQPDYLVRYASRLV